jgi:hypothetical protein
VVQFEDMKKHQKGFVIPLLIAIIAILAISGGVYFYSENNRALQINGPENKIVQNNNSTSSSPNITIDNKNIPKQISTTTPTPSTSSFAVSGYVVYMSPSGEAGCGMLPDGRYTTPCDPEYDFLIIGDSNTSVTGSLPSMSGFPSITNSHYKYISFKGFKNEIPNIGKSVIVRGIINNKVKLNPPYTFPMTATSIGLK